MSDKDDNGINAEELAKSKLSVQETQGKVSSTSFISSMCYQYSMLFFDKNLYVGHTCHYMIGKSLLLMGRQVST